MRRRWWIPRYKRTLSSTSVSIGNFSNYSCCRDDDAHDEGKDERIPLSRLYLGLVSGWALITRGIRRALIRSCARRTHRWTRYVSGVAVKRDAFCHPRKHRRAQPLIIARVYRLVFPANQNELRGVMETARTGLPCYTRWNIIRNQVVIAPVAQFVHMACQCQISSLSAFTCSPVICISINSSSVLTPRKLLCS